MRLLLTRQEGGFIEAGDLLAHADGQPVPSLGPVGRRAGHRGQDRVAGVGVIEAGVRDVFDPRAEDATGVRTARRAVGGELVPIGLG